MFFTTYDTLIEVSGRKNKPVFFFLLFDGIYVIYKLCVLCSVKH
jgi:hypothetical protein